MSTTIRPELSLSNKYWIERHRYYELKHFCLQYPIWKKVLASLDGLQSIELGREVGNSQNIPKPVEQCVEKRLYYTDRIELVEAVAKQASPDLWRYILKGVTTGISYDCFKARLEIPCCKDIYYDLYRRFFWLLDKACK